MREYLRERAGLFILFFVCGLLFALSFWLLNLPMKAVWYPSALCLIALSAFIARDVLARREKHRALQELLKTPEALPGALEPYDAESDRDYRALIAMLSEQNAAMAQKDAEQLSDMTDYYTTWAHQIKTPIASMRLTLSGEDTPAARRLGDDLSRVEQYVQMAMGYLRVNSSSTDYVIREISLDQVLKSCIRSFRTQFITRGLRLNYPGTDRTVISDEKWLSFVIEQVLSNALKYTREGSITIDVQGDALRIADTGIGIAPEDLPRIFEKGYTGFNGRVDKRASGLGLYLCSRICANLGHTLRAESVVGKGTTIWIGLSREAHIYE